MKITLSKLSTKDLATLVQRTINSSQSGNYPVINNHPLLNELIINYAQYDEVYTKLIYSGKGQDVARSDRDRDLSFRTLKNFLNGYRKMTSLAHHHYAGDLYQIIKTYGLDLDKASYSSQTAQMKKLIEVLEEPENLQKIASLQITAAFTDMKSKQVNFENIFAEQVSANADLRQMKSASAIRRNLEKVFKSYMNLITAMKNVADWQLFYADINELVKAAKNSSLDNQVKSSNNNQTN